MKHKSWDGLECQTRIGMWGTDRYVWEPFWLRWEPLGRRGGGPSSRGSWATEPWFHFFICPPEFFLCGNLETSLGGCAGHGGGCGVWCRGAGCWGLWRGCWAGVSGVPWGWVLGAAEGAIGGVVGVPQGEGAGSRGGGVWWGGTGRRGGGCWGLRWARWRRSAGAVGVGAGGRGEGGGGGQRGAVGVGAGSRGEAGRVRQTASINTPGPPPPPFQTKGMKSLCLGIHSNHCHSCLTSETAKQTKAPSYSPDRKLYATGNLDNEIVL